VKAAARVARKLAAEFGPREWHIYGGIGLVAAGCYEVSPALALVVAGAALLALPAYLRWLAGARA
jgi:hypothetical protein